MCPWPRIQAAMMDADALSVTYRVDRGEPRGPHKKGGSWEGRGDCVDCRQCVAVCPMGIDIRDGDQLECINCALCIDACDAIMKKVGRPAGLIAYDSYANVARRARSEKARFRFIRPRTLLYGSLMAIVGVLMIYGLATRETLALNVIRDRSPPFVRLSDGSIRNDYALKLINMSAEPRRVSIAVTGLEGAHLIGAAPQQREVIAEAHADAVTTMRLHVVVPPGVEPGSHDLRFTIRDVESGDSASSASAFLAGGVR
jgi:cytochrome c oxidase accessory protein FixG